ncbi:MAG: hypothetical protein WC856_02520 [Methylococcaceae bacterium]|jgi:hypothetical protein
MRVISIDDKDPVEIIPVTFDFTKEAASVDGAVITLSVVEGTDAAAISMIFGSYQITDKVVSQLIRNGVSGVTYLIRCEITSGNQKYAKSCYMTARTQR